MGTMVVRVRELLASRERSREQWKVVEVSGREPELQIVHGSGSSCGRVVMSLLACR